MVLDPILTQTAWAECALSLRSRSFMGKDMLIPRIITREFPERMSKNIIFERIISQMRNDSWKNERILKKLKKAGRELELTEDYSTIDRAVKMGCRDGKSGRNKISVMDAERRIDLFARNFAKPERQVARLRGEDSSPEGILVRPDIPSLPSLPVHSRALRLLDSWQLHAVAGFMHSVVHLTLFYDCGARYQGMILLVEGISIIARNI